MERRDRTSVASFVQQVAAPGTVDLEGDALQHAIVRRVAAGDAVRLLSGHGHVAEGVVSAAARRRVSVDVQTVTTVPKPTPLEVLVPVADKDRMLWAAEKCVELRITAWRPVMFGRSSSVAGRGEGEKFAEKVAARMRSALEQSGGAWLPEMHPDSDAATALNGVPASFSRLLLDAHADTVIGAARTGGATAIAVGPEGGLEHGELDAAVAAGWRLISLGDSILRFETAIISAAAIVRAAQLTQRSA